MSDHIKARLDQLYANVPAPTDAPLAPISKIDVAGGPPTSAQLTKIMKRFEARKASYERHMNQLAARGDDVSGSEEWVQLMRRGGRR